VFKNVKHVTSKIKRNEQANKENNREKEELRMLRMKRPSTGEPLEAVVVAVGEGNMRGGLAGFEEPTFAQPTAKLLAALGSTTTSPDHHPEPVPAGLDQPWSRSWQDWDDAVVATAVGAIKTQRGSSDGGGWEVTREAVEDGLLKDRAVLVARSNRTTRHTAERTCQLLFERCACMCTCTWYNSVVMRSPMSAGAVWMRCTRRGARP
jgi:hypothetical protein